MATGLFNLKQVNQAIGQGSWSGYIAPKWVEYLVVAGGGGAAINRGGGGGAGGLLTGIVTVTAGTSYTVTVGAGGAAKSVDGQGNNGVASVFGAISTTGGGGGGNNTGSIGTAGGSGGGSGNSGTTYGGAGVAGQGNAGGGGFYTASNYGGGGGGGAATIGGTGTGSLPGNGGAGIASAISGVVATYAGGGGGAGYALPGAGGVGGGGSGSTGSNGGNGTANTGGGGGASTSGPCGAGGSGVVIVRYPGNVQFFTGGTVNYANGYIIHIFTSSGTLAPTTPTPYSTSYQISRSLRFNSADSANLTRTPASATNQKTWTWSGWVKRSALYANLTNPATLFNAGGNGFLARFSYANPDQLEFYNYSSSAFQLQVVTTAQYRDPSAWYHIVFVLDTTQATSSDRFKVYVNGTQVTAFGTATYPSQNADMLVNGTTVHALGVLNGIGGYYDGYMTEINFVDGQALTPSSFGATSTTTGVWSPIQYTGTYGTNGFYVNFSDNSNTTAATLGKDYSGNGNNWTPNNFSVTAGAGNDSMVDSPTAYGLDTGVGGTVRGNYATMNPLQKSSNVTLTNGNLDSAVGSSDGKVLATIGMSSGKWYAETSNFAGLPTVGLATGASSLSVFTGGDVYSWGYYPSGTKYTNGSSSAYGASWTTTDTIGIAFDADAGTLTFYKNGTSQGTAFSSLTSGPYFFSNGNNSSTSCSWNFGQRPFAYTAPSGFKALCTQNLTTPAIGASSNNLANQFFAPVLYTGTGSSQSITGLSFQPDLVWTKSRSNAYNNTLVDAVRGVSKALVSDLTAAEDNTAGAYVTAFNSDGFSVGTGTGSNGSGATYVGWSWKANGAGASNTRGSITSTVSANTTSGFSIVTYTATGAAATIGHGLGAVPSMIIVKSRSGSSASYFWAVWHRSVYATDQSGYLNMSSTNGTGSASGVWSTTFPTTNVFSIGGDTSTSANTATYVAYCFAPVAGFSAFGSYTGNGSADGPFVYTGFRPAFVMIKRTDAVSSWEMHDTTRATYNVDDKNLYANLSDAEATYTVLDELSNGFKLRTTLNGTNASGGTYIYMAFASAPLKFSLAR